MMETDYPIQDSFAPNEKEFGNNNDKAAAPRGCSCPVLI